MGPGSMCRMSGVGLQDRGEGVVVRSRKSHDAPAALACMSITELSRYAGSMNF